jgi:hypothetical protein
MESERSRKIKDVSNSTDGAGNQETIVTAHVSVHSNARVGFQILFATVSTVRRETTNRHVSEKDIRAGIPHFVCKRERCRERTDRHASPRKRTTDRMVEGKVENGRRHTCNICCSTTTPDDE